jgi:hypothetical protein
MPDSSFATTRAIMRWLLAAFFVAGGVAHLAVPGEFLKITPDWGPFAPQVIFVTGLCELAGALALVTKPLRTWAGIALAVYAVWCGPPISSTPSAASTSRIFHRAGGITRRGSPCSRGSCGGRCFARALSTGLLQSSARVARIE